MLDYFVQWRNKRKQIEALPPGASSKGTPKERQRGARFLKSVSHPEITKKHKKFLFWHLRSSKVIEFGANREPVYDFLLVINSNLGSVSHHY